MRKPSFYGLYVFKNEKPFNFINYILLLYYYYYYDCVLRLDRVEKHFSTLSTLSRNLSTVYACGFSTLSIFHRGIHCTSSFSFCCVGVFFANCLNSLNCKQIFKRFGKFFRSNSATEFSVQFAFRRWF